MGFVIALTVFLKGEREIQTKTFVSFMGVCRNVSDVSRQPAQAEACRLSQTPEEL